VNVVNRLAALPIRLRLILAFAVAMAVVLAATGLFLYVRLGDSLDRTIDQSLRERADDVGALARRSDSRLAERGASIAQILDPGGSVVDSSRELGRPLLTRSEIARAQRAQIEIPGRDVPGSDEPARLLAKPSTHKEDASWSWSGRRSRSAARLWEAYSSRF
jgi:hypothetical protein